jgi:hypothetical protein
MYMSFCIFCILYTAFSTVCCEFACMSFADLRFAELICGLPTFGIGVVLLMLCILEIPQE